MRLPTGTTDVYFPLGTPYSIAGLRFNFEKILK